MTTSLLIRATQLPSGRTSTLPRARASPRRPAQRLSRPPRRTPRLTCNALNRHSNVGNPAAPAGLPDRSGVCWFGDKWAVAQSLGFRVIEGRRVGGAGCARRGKRRSRLWRLRDWASREPAFLCGSQCDCTPLCGRRGGTRRDRRGGDLAGARVARLSFTAGRAPGATYGYWWEAGRRPEPGCCAMMRAWRSRR